MQSVKETGKTALASAAVLAIALASTVAAAQELSDLKNSPPLLLKGQGTFFIDGTTHPVGPPVAGFAGNSMINQMYVQFQKPILSTLRNKYPIVFVHGCCLSSKSWQTTPDGRMGWDEYFVRRGFDTYLADQVGRGRSGFDATKYLEARAGLIPPSDIPNILIATDALAWAAFRWGDFSTLTPFPDERFPMKTVGVGTGSTLTFYNQIIPDLNGTLSLATSPSCTDGPCTPSTPSTAFNTPVAMAQLADKLGGAILVGHSESSGYPTMAALRPDLHGVKGIVQLETGCFSNLTPADINVLKDIPILILVADHYSTPQPPASCVTEMGQVNGAGGDMTFISLPNDKHIYGNSHMMMLDNNNLQVADVIIDWIEDHVGKKKHVAWR